MRKGWIRKAQTCTSCSLGEHPNHLDHQATCFSPLSSSSLRALWSGLREARKQDDLTTVKDIVTKGLLMVAPLLVVAHLVMAVHLAMVVPLMMMAIHVMMIIPLEMEIPLTMMVMEAILIEINVDTQNL